MERIEKKNFFEKFVLQPENTEIIIFSYFRYHHQTEPTLFLNNSAKTKKLHI